MNNYFFYEINKNILSYFFKKKNVFIFKKNLKKKKFLNNIKFIRDDIYNFQDHADICIKSIKILDEIKLTKYSSNDKILDKVLKRNLLINTEDILRTVYLYEKIKKEYELDNFYICHFFNDLELYNYLKNKNFISDKIKISKIYYLANKIYLFLEKIFFFFNLIILPEKVFLFCRKNIKKKYNAIFNVDEEPTSSESIYVQIRQKLKKNSLIIKDIKLKESFFKKSYKKNKYLNFFFLKNIFSKISLFSYVTEFYPNYFLERFSLIFSLNSNYKELYRYFCNKICWEIFFYSFEVNKCLTAMSPWDLTSQYIQKKNSKETIFLYFSSTPHLTKTIKSEKGVDHLQYNFMNYSTLISNNISKKYLDKKINYFNNFLDFGNYESSLVINYKNQKNFLKKKYKLDQKKFTIGLFDNSIGFTGVLSSSEYLKYLKYLNYLVSKYKNYLFIYRKKNQLNFFSSETHNYKDLNSELKKLYNQKNFTDLNYEISAPEIISVSDIVLSQPFSSIIFDSLLAHKTTIIFDNMKNKKVNDLLYSRINNQINICNTKYKFRLLDKDILNIIKINSKNSYKIIRNRKNFNFLNKVSEYIDK